MREVVIVDAIRTPIGRYKGALKDVRPDDLGALAIIAPGRKEPCHLSKNLPILNCTPMEMQCDFREVFSLRQRDL